MVTNSKIKLITQNVFYKGVTNEINTSNEKIFITFELAEDIFLNYYFNVVNNNFPIGPNGILGRGFYEKYVPKILYKYCSVTFNISNNKITISLQYTSNEYLFISRRIEDIF